MKLEDFKSKNLYNALQTFFKDLNVPLITEEGDNLPLILEQTKDLLGKSYNTDNESQKLIEDLYFIGSVNDLSFNKKVEKDSKEYETMHIIGINLKLAENKFPTKSSLSEIVRLFNRAFKHDPVTIVFKYHDYISFATCERSEYKRNHLEGEKVGKVSLLKDISITNTHSGHLRILESLKINKDIKNKITTFEELYKYWQEVFNVSILNKKFYQELSNWYFWAIKQVSFPSEPTLEEAHQKQSKIEDLVQEHKAKNVIRLLTRLLFVWFIKEKNLIPEALFDLKSLQDEILNEISPYHEEGLFQKANRDSIYYKAILQNLFFATLNCPIKPTEENDNRVRSFRKSDNYGQNRGADFLMRYQKYFKEPQKFLEIVNNVVPFLNGGLFECLDDKLNSIYIDGFSDNENLGKNLIVPDYLFFGIEEKVDLSTEYGIKNKGTQESAVKGLVNILKSYKFTVDENTPLEEEIALDPELLGKVFENLLASYNPETKTTARKQTGSFYTPREIVNYMVDESLIAYLKEKLISNCSEDSSEEDIEKELRKLFSYAEEKIAFSEEEINLIIKELNNCKILDPACGSGAFPMGVLQKMVHVLKKLDPDNSKWEREQREKTIGEKIKELEEDKEAIKGLKDEEVREKAKKAVDEKLKDIEDVFRSENNFDDYSRKLYLIENCIYGLDIQPIATQISKLRFFISLIVDQIPDKEKDNFGIRPLPNLETKFVAANTLIGIEKPKAQMNIFSLDKELNNLEKELKDNRHKLFSAKSPATKKRLREKDKEFREKMANLLIKTGLTPDNAKKLSSWNPYDQNVSSEFFDMDWMFGIKSPSSSDGKSGFDIIIGNPPYIGQKNNNNIFREIKYSSIGERFHQRRMDYFYFFIHQGIDFLKDKSFLILITTNYFFTATYADKLRNDIKARTSIKLLIDFNEMKVFDTALGQHNAISMLQKGYVPNEKIFTTYVNDKELYDSNILELIFSKKLEKCIYDVSDNNLIYDKVSNYIRIKTSNVINNSEGEDPIINKISQGSIPLSSICNLVEGIHTGADKVSENHQKKYSIESDVGKGIFVLTKKELENLSLNKEEKELIKPWFKNSDIDKWCIVKKPKFNLIYITTKKKYDDISNIKNYLSQFKLILINRKVRSGTGIISLDEYDSFVQGKKYISYVMNASAFQQGFYYLISYPRDINVFMNEKIILPQRSSSNIFAYSKGDFFASADVYFIIQNDKSVNLKYILSLLNSKLYLYWLLKKGKKKGDMLELYIRPLSEILLKKISEEKQIPFIEIVDQIIEKKKNNEETKELEDKIDLMVYKLYDLTYEEVKIVEPDFKLLEVEYNSLNI